MIARACASGATSCVAELISISPARFAALTNKTTAATSPVIAARRIGNRARVCFSRDGLVKVDMAFFFREGVTVWRENGWGKNSQSLLDQEYSIPGRGPWLSAPSGPPPQR